MLFSRRFLHRCGNNTRNGSFDVKYSVISRCQSFKGSLDFFRQTQQRLVGTVTDLAVIDRSLEVEEDDPIRDGIKFYSRVMDEIRKHQGLLPGPDTRYSREYNLIRNHAENKDHYDLRELLIRLNFVLSHLSEISPGKYSPDGNAEETKELLNSKLNSSPPASVVTLVRPYTMDALPRLPERFENAEMLTTYLHELTSRRYVRAMKIRPHVVSELVRDLLRPNSPDTAHCRTTEAYNIGIKYFIHTQNLKSARMLLEQMKADVGVKPNTESYNLMFAAIPKSLVGGKREYKRYYFNHFVRQKYLGLKPNSSGQLNNSQLPVTSKDIVYFHHPLEFLIANLKEMTQQEIPADDETWNIVLSCARGLVAKSHVLKHMHNLRIPLSETGLKSVVCDTADFMGPQKVIELIREQQFVTNVTSIKAVIARMIDVPSDKNINAAWSLLLSVSEGTQTTMSKTIKPTVSILNVFAHRFAQAGRIDWILGLMQAMQTQWNVYPNIKTYTYLLEAAVRPLPHYNKPTLLRVIYAKLLESAKRTISPSSSMTVASEDLVLPPQARYWMRRARKQFEFLTLIKNKQQALATDASSDSNQAQIPLSFSSSSETKQLSDPFSINLTQYKCSSQAAVDDEFWNHACKLLEWPTTNATSLKLSYTGSQKTPLKALIEKLGIRKPSLSAYQSVKHFESSPKDMFACFAQEWIKFNNESKLEFRASLDEAERDRRQKFLENPYNAYLDDLRHEFQLCK